MKAIFTGTEQDLIECGFEYIGDYFSLVKDLEYDLYGRKINNEKQIVYNEYAKSLTIQNYNRDKKFKMKNIYIQDLIDKKLVRWE